MVGNPRYGRIGLLALPYYFAVELLAPLVELSALVLVPVGLLVGAVDLDLAWRFPLVAYAYACFVSLVAVAVEEVSFHRYNRWRDLAAVLAAAVLENIGYRQITAYWRLQGFLGRVARPPAGLGHHDPPGLQHTGRGLAVIARIITDEGRRAGTGRARSPAGSQRSCGAPVDSGR
jgi:hypothetical protein